VVSISDGDTLTVMVDRQQVKVRLADIDAPERKQPYGTRARQSLAELEQIDVGLVAAQSCATMGMEMLTLIPRLTSGAEKRSLTGNDRGVAWKNQSVSA